MRSIRTKIELLAALAALGCSTGVAPPLSHQGKGNP